MTLRTFYDTARGVFPLLPPFYEETDACITPECNGLNVGGLPIFCVPPSYTLMPDEGYHEAGHAYLKLLERQQPGVDFLARYWTFRGFPGTWQAALAGSQADPVPNSSWMRDPRESWAEAFACGLDASHNEKTLNWGLTRSSLELQTWFRQQDIAHPVAPPPSTPTIEWVGPAAAGNFMSGRSGQSIALIVDHWVGAGTLEQAVQHFKNPGTQVSAHYVVGTDGRIVQVVKDQDTAFHAGVWQTNLRSIGIEHECHPTLPPTEALYRASSLLHRHLADTHGLVLAVGTTVRRHRDIVATQCPGTLDVERIVSMALDYVSKADFDAYKVDVANTLNAMKAQYDPLVPKAHTHTANVTVAGGKT